MSSQITIAVDGPASSGKGTVARLVAQSLGYAYIDTGAMYRTVALRARQQSIPWTDAAALGQLTLTLRFDFRWDGDGLRIFEGGEDLSEAIRTEEIGRGASDVSVHPPVRAALLDRQRALGARGGVVMDGRDIGTVVLPEAELKVFLDADMGERARRRFAELWARGVGQPLRQVTQELTERDAQDRSRPVAPLRQAADAVYVDTTHDMPAQAAERIVRMARALLDGAPPPG